MQQSFGDFIGTWVAIVGTAWAIYTIVKITIFAIGRRWF